MGNGPGIKKTVAFDIETSGLSVNVDGSPLTQDDINDAVAKSIMNFGAPNQVIFSPIAMNMFMGRAFSLEINPQYAGTPWVGTSRMTQREHAVAKLHTLLRKLKVLKKLSDEDMEEIKNKSIQRLKRAKWARYQKKA